MQKKYAIRLSHSEREILNASVGKRRVSGQKVLRARVLLKADADGPSWTDAEIAEAFDCCTKGVENLRERFVTQGFEIPRIPLCERQRWHLSFQSSLRF
jgi:hypothetical protein